MARTPVCDNSSGLRKGTWTPEEDRKLVVYVTRYGTWNWRQLPKFAGLKRCGKSCRLRWLNYLRPDLKRGNFTKEEDETIIRLHSTLGNKWSAIAAKLPGRTDNEIKNHWHTCLKQETKITKKQEKAAITHKNGKERREWLIRQGSASGSDPVLLESSPASPQPCSTNSSMTTSQSSCSASSLFDLDPLADDIWDYSNSNYPNFLESQVEKLSVDDIPFLDFSTSPQASSSNHWEANEDPSSSIPIPIPIPSDNLLEVEFEQALLEHHIWKEALAADTSPNNFPAADLFLDLDFFVQDSLFAQR